ncbi:aldo/keto reductase [Luteipulveratus sp. YIM 133132]|uniref:aldo/keto reductase n=1 Tax=Luteipulveratus flavus TaxID=3031728 RepID=UPI0023AE8218|nr:aldo/keto reductase [Luteipulveratus sp. YIM 133132]MDE9366988.1 aldo/keto reductase [Luteipulveratus sp. YIM 133132]
MPRTRVVIQSRLNSSRLPGKALMTVAGMPLIELVARRASRSGHEVVVATSDEHYDTRIADHLATVGIPVMRGDLDDVLGRFVAATQDLAPTDRVVRLTGDNPVMDADVVDELLAAMDESGHAYGRVDIDVVPEGLGAEAFWVSDLRRAAESTTDPYDREHVTPWLRRELGELLFAPEGNPGDPRRFRCSVDNLNDFDRVSRIFATTNDPVGISWRELLEVLREEVEAEGATVPLRGPEDWQQSAFVLGGVHLAGTDAPAAPEVRSLLITAVSRGVTHVDVGRADGPSMKVLRANLNPQLTRRLGYLCRLRPLRGGGALAVEASLERTFAEMGERRVAAALVSGPEDADEAAWERLREYQRTGEVGRIGVALWSGSEIDQALALPGIGYLELPFNVLDDLPAEALEALRAADVVVCSHHTFAGGALLGDGHPALPTLSALSEELGRDGVDDLCVAFVLGHDVITSAIIGCADDAQVRHVADLVARPPLGLAEIARVRAALAGAAR